MLFCEPEEDAAQGDRIGVKFKEWSNFWRVGEEVLVEYKPWEDTELRKKEEALPLFEVKALRKAAANHKATTGVGVDRFHPRVPPDLSDECRERILTLLHKVEMAEVNASTTLFLLIPTTGERPIALLLKLIRWWESPRVPSVFE